MKNVSGMNLIFSIILYAIYTPKCMDYMVVMRQPLHLQSENAMVVILVFTVFPHSANVTFVLG